MATNPTIQFKRKTSGSGAPATLAVGEPAVNTTDSQFYIGTTTTTVKWVGAEIENSSTNGTTWTSDLKLATKKAIGDYFAPLSGATFTGDITLSGGSDIRFRETGGGTDYVAFQAPSVVSTGNVTLTLPGSYAAADGYVLSSTTTGTLSWISAGSASSVTVTEASSNASYNLIFTDATSTTSASIFIDSDDLISYNPSTNLLTLGGDLAVNGSDITTTSTGTATLFNTNATTLNMGGVATSVTIGATSGTTTTVRGGVIVGNTASQDVFDTTATTINAFGAATTCTIGHDGTSNSTTNIATGTTAALGTKTLNLATNGNASATVNVNIGTTGDGTCTINSPSTDIQGDLTVRGGDIISSTATTNLVNSTVTTLNFAGAATTVSIGAATGTTTINNANTVVTGDLAVNGADITTTATGTATLFNTNATTVNIAGAGTTVSIGAATGKTTINNATTIVTGDLEVNGSDIGTTSTGAATLFNANALTLNMGGAATTVSIGAATGTTTINNANTVVTGDLAVNGADITTTSTGTATLFNTNATTVNIGGAATSMTIGASTATINLGGGTTGATVVIKGNLQVDGVTTTINSTTLLVDDKLIELAHSPGGAAGNDASINGGGIQLNSSDSNKTFTWIDATDAWTSSEHMNLLTGKAYYINGTSVLNSTTLGSTVTSSSLTTVGTIASGTWNGTAIGAAYGGTGQTSYTVGDIIYASATTAISKLSASSTAGAVLASTGAASAPEYKTISFTNGSVTSGSGTLTLAVQNAAADSSTKGIATFDSTQFDAATGLITLDTIDGGTYA